MSASLQPEAAAKSFSVHIDGLSHHYGKVTALENISLQLASGETIGLIGPDGVGKSTLLSVIAGVKIIQQGQVKVLGGNMADKSFRRQNSSRIAFMPQGLGKNLYPTLSVYENIDFFASLFGLRERERGKRIRHLLDATGLAPFPDRPAGKLSGGMKQKLSLCCSLVHDPDLLILDEPTTGVDPLARRQFWSLVDSMRADRPDMSVIVATAYIEEAQNFKYIIAMDNGKILVNDLTSKVLEDTKSQTLEEAYVKLLPKDRKGSGTGLKIPPFVPEKDSPPAIEAENLTRKFGDFTAVDKVNFRIERGEIFGFLGSNGCGKSTTMKMLTGLLEVTSGTARLLGRPIDSKNMHTRMRVGYMSQSFSLYEELTVRQNLVLHAQLYQIPSKQRVEVVNGVLNDFDLNEVADSLPMQVSLGIRQRLQLAAACLHKPEVLILDEPTSGVDPAARDMFWRRLVHLSREEKVTIFVSTHFMNEAERCDRISLMHQGRVLAMGKPKELQEKAGSPTLEEAFISYLEKEGAKENDGEIKTAGAVEESAPSLDPAKGKSSSRGWRQWWKIVGSFARRETKELLRDKIRLTFAIAGPVVLLLVAAWNVSFDVANVKFTVLDRDQSASSRELIEQFSGSHYFNMRPLIHDTAEVDTLLRGSRVRMVIEIPPDFGRDLLAGRQPKVAFYIDGAQPFTAENVRGFISGILLQYTQNFMRSMGTPQQAALPASLEPRFVYNQEFRSIYAIAPGLVMLALILIPTMLTALGVVREKEIGSIINLYASPAGVSQYLIGKQLPYVAVGMVSYVTLVLLSISVLGVPVRGSFLSMSFGALLFVMAGTAFGLLISCFVRSQVAAMFASAIICLIPSLNFSGLLYPVSTLTGSSRVVGLGFPSSWYQLISLGAFTKGLDWRSFLPMYAALAAFAAAYLLAACLLLKKQEV